MGISKFPGTLLPISHHFYGNIGDGSFLAELPLICHRRFTILLLLIIAYICVLFKVMSP